MTDRWSIETHGDPLGSVRQLIRAIWQQAGLAGLLVTIGSANEQEALPSFITDPSYLDKINPFRPLMEMNIARLVPGVLASHPGQPVAAVLRPCELRALIEMSKHVEFEHDNLLTISIDCLGTLPADEYQWRRERIEKSHGATDANQVEEGDELSDEALKFARQGGIIPYRYRAACQVCVSPAAENADVNVSLLGLPVRQLVLISISNPQLARAIDLDKLAVKRAAEFLLTGHEHVVAKMSERHERTLERVNQGLGSVMPADIDALISQLEGCGDCQACMDVCPICSVDRPRRDAAGHYERSAVMRWLVSCAGCGMCEQACPNDLPISSIFSQIRRGLDQEFQYLPGRSFDEPLPVI